MSGNHPRAVLVVAVAVAGIAFAAAYNTYARAAPNLATRSSDLADVVELMEAERVGLEDSLLSLRESMASIESRAAEEAGLADSFNSELEAVRVTAGLSGVRGPGLLVTLADAEVVPLGQDPSACLIHDFDIEGVVNALFAAGAEAVSVNDERIVPTSAVRCAGNTILVNSRRLGNPYTVLAVGDSEKLEETLLSDETIATLFETYPAVYGLKVQFERLPAVEIPPYRGSLRTDYATAMESGG